MSAAAPSPQQVISLYRSFMRNASRFNDYNFKNYFLRRSRDAFEASKDLKDPESIAEAYAKAQRELAVLERQSKISQMYSFDKLVVEPLSSNHKKSSA